MKVENFTLDRLEKYKTGISLSYFLRIALKIDKLYKSTSANNYLHKISGVDQGNAQQLKKQQHLIQFLISVVTLCFVNQIFDSY